MFNDESKLIPISQAAEILQVSVATLRRWDESGKLPAVRKTPDGNRYYRELDLNIFPNDLLTLAYEWASADTNSIPQIPPKLYCEDSSIFDTRLTKLATALEATPGLEEMFSLVASAAGEIGNNSFDHNLGKWVDIPGVFFGYNIQRREIVLADRGLGILATLGRVVELKSHEEALTIAFTKVISGRAPESRGNGLKYVHKIVTENPISLVFKSGNAELEINMEDSAINVHRASRPLSGCIALIRF